MKNLFRGVLVALAFVSANVLAGATNPQSVVIDMDIRTAQGDMVTARTAETESDLIGCGIRVFDDGLGNIFQFGFCQAEDATGQIVTCMTQQPEMVAAIGRLSDFSYISFSWNDVQDCTRVANSTQSWYLPKNVKGNK